MCWVFTNLLLPAFIGMAASYLVSRRFHRIALLNESVRLMKRLCPYRKENVRGGDGLNETSWALKIESEMLEKNGFYREASVVENLSKQIGEASELPNHNDKQATTARDEEKKKWQQKLSKLY